MKRAVVVAAAVGVAAVLWSKRRMVPKTSRNERSRWRVVTIQRSEADVIGAMAPLSALSGVETRLVPAPGNRGTELAARIIDGKTEPDALRIALRQTKQLAEAGEIAAVQPAPHGPRKTTPQGALLDFVAKKSEGKGVL